MGRKLTFTGKKGNNNKGNCKGSLIIKHLFISEKEFDVHKYETIQEEYLGISTQQEKLKNNKNLRNKLKKKKIKLVTSTESKQI